MNYFIEHKRGLLGTIVFHLVLVIILIIFGFTTPLPLPEEEGILINFGVEEQGSGLIEPSEASTPPKKVQKKSTPPPSAPVVATPEPAKEEVLTQDIEETVAIPAKKEKVKPKKKDPKELEAERKRQEELEKERQKELERKHQEEIERKKREEEQKIKEASKNRAQTAFSGKNTADNKSTGEGNTLGKGNQGGENGSTESKNSTGKGYGNEGVSFNLDGRRSLSLPLPECKYQKEETVVVQVTVDRNGKVTKATPGVKGSTTLVKNFLEAAKKAALKARFNEDQDAPPFQKGTIVYKFILE